MYRLWHQPWFHASTGGLGRGPRRQGGRCIVPVSLTLERAQSLGKLVKGVDSTPTPRSVGGSGAAPLAKRPAFGAGGAVGLRDRSAVGSAESE